MDTEQTVMAFGGVCQQAALQGAWKGGDPIYFTLNPGFYLKLYISSSKLF